MRRWTKRLIACTALLLASAPVWALSPFILFDSGSARLSPAAQVVLDNAVAQIRSLDIRQIEIIGSTDRVGSDAANLALSRRRAEAVRDALLAKGMSRYVRVVIISGGETLQPLVRTEDGIADPQNRNVVIVMTGGCVDWTRPGDRRLTGGECDTPLPD